MIRLFLCGQFQPSPFPSGLLFDCSVRFEKTRADDLRGRKHSRSACKLFNRPLESMAKLVPMTAIPQTIPQVVYVTFDTSY